MNLFAADTASLGENGVLLAVPWSRIFDSVTAVGSQPRRWKGLQSRVLIAIWFGCDLLGQLLCGDDSSSS